MGINKLIRAGLAGAAAALLAFQPLSMEPATAVTAQTRTIQGSASDMQQKLWFQRAFDTEERFFGSLRGNIRFVTDTTATLSTTRTISTTDRGSMDAGSSISTTINSSSVASRLQLTARPALQLIFEWQPRGEAYECDNTTFPTFSGDQWFKRRDGGGRIADGVCGAIEVTADDLNRILDQFQIDLELPEVFNLMDKAFNPGSNGTQTLSESHPLFDIKVCKIVSDTFGLPIGDHCDIEVNAVVDAPLTTLGHDVDAQLCMDGSVNGNQFDCVVPIGEKRSITFPSNGTSVFSTKAPCTTAEREIDVRLTDPAWRSRLEGVTIRPTADFNVHLRADGDGIDLATFDLPGSISLLDQPMPLDVTYPDSNNFLLHVGEVTPDDDAPLVNLNPATVTVDEGSSATLAPFMADSCTATSDLTAAWQIDGVRPVFGPTLTRRYDNDLPNPVHNGTLQVTDEAGNQSSEVPFTVKVRNVPPSVQLAGLPANPVPLGTTLDLRSHVSDPGADIETWSWSFGDGTNASRTAASVTDRADARTHTYDEEGLYTLQLGVRDGTDLRSAGGVVTVFDPRDKLVGSGNFIADGSSNNVPVGSTYSVHANVAYPRGAVRPTGSFTSDFLIDIGSNETVPKHLVGTDYEWVFDDGRSAVAQGLATLNGETGWKFHAEVTRSSTGSRTVRMTVAVWRPGVTTLANPDYRFGGPRDTGNIH